MNVSLATANHCDSSSLPTSAAPPRTLDIASMGWFTSGSKDDSGPAKTSGGAFESPSRSNRKQCYAARDAFFECLDKNNVLDSINTKTGREKAQTFCGQLDQDFEKNCAHSWVSEIADSGGTPPHSTRACKISIWNDIALEAAITVHLV